jgi:uncharacterized sporulation protein YeaH/YhbH (DUF444 family)
LTHLIDRRQQSKNKSAVNRERFLRRYKEQVKKAVEKAVKGRSITEIEGGEKISIPSKDLNEPSFGHGRGGIWETISPGNTEFLKGDKINRPQGGGGRGNGGAGNTDETSEDDFIFELSREEFMNYFFEDLELPNMVKKQLESAVEFKQQRAGYTVSGTPANIHVLRSLRGALARRIAVTAAPDAELAEAQDELEQLELRLSAGHPDLVRARERVDGLKRRIASVPWIDPFDLRYSNRIKVPKPSSQCVMFCLMDVSGSMDQQKKDIAKRFFILLYLFLTKMYEKIELVFIRHHTQAAEVNEQDFFHSRESGGTVVSSALHLLDKILTERYSGRDWNVYVAQASDGDNWDKDSSTCRQLLTQTILSKVQYYAYVEITEGEPQNLWYEYLSVAEAHGHFAMQKIQSPADIYPVFRDLFKKQTK